MKSSYLKINMMTFDIFNIAFNINFLKGVNKNWGLNGMLILLTYLMNDQQFIAFFQLKLFGLNFFLLDPKQTQNNTYKLK